MTEEQLLETILKTSYVKADVMRRIRIVREYLEQKFFTPGDKKELKEFLVASQVPVQEQEVIDAWGKDFFTSFTKENAYDYLEQMTAKVKDLPTINLYVPIPVEAKEAIVIGTWVRANIDKMALVELHTESSTFGGCAFAWNGVYYDYSLRHYMRKKMDSIRNIITAYAAPKS
jgi:F0F1-type ATP synthase delta subunit